ncbi:MAG: prepilin-type N-terminal cleavage/methylation domain-containing protein [Pseudomonadales bacterium]
MLDAPSKRSAGFTLIELVMVIVILSILAVGTTRYIVNSAQSFVVSAERAKLIATARVAVEKVARRLRNALPNSVRISTSGRCLEYFPVLRGSATTSPVLPGTSSLSVSAIVFSDVQPANYAAIAPFASSELYVTGAPSPGVITATTLTAVGTHNIIPLGTSHTFTRTSPTQRVYLVANPERFCVTVSGNLERYTGYGINSSSPIADTAPTSPMTATTSLVAENLDIAGGAPFVYTTGTLVSNGLVQVNFTFTKGLESVNLSHGVQIRNVP